MNKCQGRRAMSSSPNRCPCTDKVRPQCPDLNKHPSRCGCAEPTAIPVLYRCNQKCSNSCGSQDCQNNPAVDTVLTGGAVQAIDCKKSSDFPNRNSPKCKGCPDCSKTGGEMRKHGNSCACADNSKVQIEPRNRQSGCGCNDCGGKRVSLGNKGGPSTSGAVCSVCTTQNNQKSPCSDCYKNKKYECKSVNQSLCGCNECAPKDALRFSPFSSHRAVPMQIGGRGSGGGSRPSSAKTGCGVCQEPDACETAALFSRREPKQQYQPSRRMGSSPVSRSLSPPQRYKPCSSQVTCSCGTCKEKETDCCTDDAKGPSPSSYCLPLSTHAKVCSSCWAKLRSNGAGSGGSGQDEDCQRPDPRSGGRQWVSARSTACENQESEDNVIWLSEKTNARNKCGPSSAPQPRDGENCDGRCREPKGRLQRKNSCIQCPPKNFPNIKVFREETQEGHFC